MRSEKVKFVKEWLKSEEGILVTLIIAFPVGLYLLWKYGENSKKMKYFITAVISVFALLTLSNIVTKDSLRKSLLNEISEKESVILAKEIALEENTLLQQTEKEYIAYKEKMKNYEELSELDAKKKEADLKASQKVVNLIEELPSVSDVELADKKKIQNSRTLFNALNDDQKQLVDTTIILELESKIKELEELKAKKDKEDAAKKKAEEEAAKKKAEEEARGYDTGITFDQLARNPDDYLLKKVKFYGKVIQVMEGDETTQLRIAVNDNYDTVVYAEYESSIVKSRILEDDYITISGHSLGLLSYESTMGGTITIPSVSVVKIDQ